MLFQEKSGQFEGKIWSYHAQHMYLQTAELLLCSKKSNCSVLAAFQLDFLAKTSVSGQLHHYYLFFIIIITSYYLLAHQYYIPRHTFIITYDYSDNGFIVTLYYSCYYAIITHYYIVITSALPIITYYYCDIEVILILLLGL